MRTRNNKEFKKLIIAKSKELCQLLTGTDSENFKIADETSFGYSDSFKPLCRKDKEIRHVKSHVKTELFVGVVRGKVVVVEVNTGCAHYGKVDVLREAMRIKGMFTKGTGLGLNEL